MIAKRKLFAKKLKIMGQRLHIKFHLLFSEVVIQSLSENNFFNKLGIRDNGIVTFSSAQGSLLGV